MFPAVIFNTLIFRFKPLPVFASNKAPVPDVQQRSAPGSGAVSAPEVRQGHE
jgi:hypothetical protein